MSKLFSPLKIRNIEFKNRIGVSPMCMYSAIDGHSTDWHFVHYASRAIGGAALIIQEATAVSPEGRITADDLGLWKDSQMEGLRKIVEFIENQDCIAGIQLAHAGRKASHENSWKGGKALTNQNGAWETVSPSGIPFEESDPLPVALDKNGIEKVIIDFTEAAKRAVVVGFKVVEIHAAHGYLLHQFLSPLSNYRSDEYGGNFENRIRLLTKVVENVRLVIPEDVLLFVRISATDWAEGGWNENEAVELSKVLKSKGVDLVDVSTGGLVPYAKIPVKPGFQVRFAEKVKKEADILTSAVGLITSSEQAEEILQNDQADLILMGRELLRNPYFPLYAAKELNVTIDWPTQYLRSKI